MESSSTDPKLTSDRKPTIIERIAKVLVIVGICFGALIAYFAHRENRETELNKLSGHVAGGQLTYAYPQNRETPVTAIQFRPYSLNRSGWELGGELIFCGDVRDRFRGRHWVTVKYDKSEYCAKLDSVEDDPRTARSPKDIEDCKKATTEFPTQHLEACDDQAAAVAYMAAGHRYLGSVGLDFTHDMFASGWVLTPVPQTSSCYIARVVKYRYLHDQDRVAISTYLLPPWLRFEQFSGPPDHDTEITSDDLLIGKRRLIVVPTRDSNTPQGAEERTIAALLKQYGTSVEEPSGHQVFGSIPSDSGSVSSLAGSDVLLVAGKDIGVCKEIVSNEQNMHEWSNEHFLVAASFQNESEAKRIAAELRGKHYKAWVNTQTPDGTARVTIGPLDTIQEAEIQKRKLEEDAFKAVLLH